MSDEESKVHSELWQPWSEADLAALISPVSEVYLNLESDSESEKFNEEDLAKFIEAELEDQSEPRNLENIIGSHTE
jgi:hypothetical protein